jgi:hypothetical protein
MIITKITHKKTVIYDSSIHGVDEVIDLMCLWFVRLFKGL